MKFLKLAAIAAACVVLAIVPARAQMWAVGTQIGTTGVGGELQLQLNNALVARGTVDWLSYSRDETYSDVDYSGKLQFGTGGAFLDWHPFQNGFLLSGGAYFGSRKIKLSAQPGAATSVDLGAATYTGAQVGRLTGSVKMGDVEPFAGLGYDNAFQGNAGLGFKVLLGVSFSDSPSVSLISSGGILSADPVFQADVAAEQDKIRHDAKDLQYFPVLYIGLTYRP